MEFAKIVVVSIISAVCYGILHDQVTARICIEYFTVFHPPVFQTDNPTLLGLGWGVIATWWVGAFLGIVLGIAARAGSRPRLSACELLPSIMKLLAIMAAFALASGITGYLLTRTGAVTAPNWVSGGFTGCSVNRFMADWWAHNASYGVGAIGGIVLCVLTVRRRTRLS